MTMGITGNNRDLWKSFSVEHFTYFQIVIPEEFLSSIVITNAIFKCKIKHVLHGKVLKAVIAFFGTFISWTFSKDIYINEAKINKSVIKCSTLTVTIRFWLHLPSGQKGWLMFCAQVLLSSWQVPMRPLPILQLVPHLQSPVLWIKNFIFILMIKT